MPEDTMQIVNSFNTTTTNTNTNQHTDIHNSTFINNFTTPSYIIESKNATNLFETNTTTTTITDLTSSANRVLIKFNYFYLFYFCCSLFYLKININ